MTTRIGVKNPSRHARGGVVVMPWEPVSRACGLAGDDVTVYQGKTPLRTQVDPIDPSDPSRAELVFALQDLVCEGEDDYSKICTTLTVGERPESLLGPRADASLTGVKLRWRDDRYKVWINTSTDRDGHGTWFAGAITSAELTYGGGIIDLLDAPASFKKHRHFKNKRIQVDRIRLHRGARDRHPLPWSDSFVFNQPWTTIATSHGPLRASATIRSRPFEYRTDDVGGKQTVECAAYRTFTLYEGDTRIFESICVREVKRSGDDLIPGAWLWFSPRYFALLRIALAEDPEIWRYPSLPGWFSVASVEPPRPAYGFATDSHAGTLWNPPLDYQDDDDETEDDAWMWELSVTRHARAVHILAFHTSARILADAAGSAWYDNAFRPLTGVVM
jgi:hypothetical protein